MLTVLNVVATCHAVNGNLPQATERAFLDCQRDEDALYTAAVGSVPGNTQAVALVRREQRSRSSSLKVMGDKANEVLARYARRARAKGIEIQYTATLSDLLWTYTATIKRACRVRTSVGRFGAR